ncbi:MAG TPA: hypothetical protein VFI25_12560 [Planctomycetota bacterium]|nr:hypothetical protein [Planctomycetota bacterium]
MSLLSARRRGPALRAGAGLVVAAGALLAIRSAHRGEAEVASLFESRLAGLRLLARDADEIARYRREGRAGVLERTERSRAALSARADPTAVKASLLSDASRAGVTLVRCSAGTPTTWVDPANPSPTELVAIPFECLVEGPFEACAAFLSRALGPLVVPARLLLGRCGAGIRGAGSRTGGKEGSDEGTLPRFLAGPPSARASDDHRLLLEGLFLGSPRVEKETEEPR